MEKKKKEKKPKIDFEKIDITTATEDDIINSGLGYNVKSDVICYCLMALVFVLMLVPPILRIVIPKPITKEIRNIVYGNIDCYKTISRDGYEISTKLLGNYRDGKSTDFTLEYSFRKIREDAPDDYIVSEINELNTVELKGLKKEKEDNKYVYKFDFKNHYDELITNDIIKNYSYVYSAQVSYLSNNGYYCSNKTETVEEEVYIDSGKKVEE